MADIGDRGITGMGSGMTSNNTGTPNTTVGTAGTSTDWANEDNYWRSNYSSRPYAKADRGYEHVQGGYRYGFESANRHRDRDWNAAENDLRSGWDSYEHRGSNNSTWDEVKDAARDAWHRVRGHGDSHHADRR